MPIKSMYREEKTTEKEDRIGARKELKALY